MRRHLDGSRFAPPRGTTRPAMHPGLVVSGRHVRRKRHVQRPQILLYRRESKGLARALERDGRLSAQAQAAAEHPQPAAGRGFFAPIPLLPPRAGRVDRRRRGLGPASVHLECVHARLPVLGYEELHRAGVRLQRHHDCALLNLASGLRRWLARLPILEPGQLHLRRLAPVRALHQDDLARLHRVRNPKNDRLARMQRRQRPQQQDSEECQYGLFHGIFSFCALRYGSSGR